MSESFQERLSRFTPDGSALDRDALLFAAGRASARKGRGWRALAGFLAASQILSLVLLWPRLETQNTAPVADSMSAPPVELPLPAPQSRNLWELRDQVIASEGKWQPSSPVERLMPSDPPLHAFLRLVPRLI